MNVEDKPNQAIDWVDDILNQLNTLGVSISIDPIKIHRDH